MLFFVGMPIKKRLNFTFRMLFYVLLMSLMYKQLHTSLVLDYVVYMNNKFLDI